MDSATGPTQDWAMPDSGVDSLPGGAPNSTQVPGLSDRPDTRIDAPRVPMPLRPMTVSDIVDGAFNIVKLRPRPIIAASALMTLPPAVLSAYAQRDALGTAFATTTDTSFSSVVDSSGGDIVVLLALLLSILPLPFLGAFMGRFVAEWYGGNDPDTREIYRLVLAKTHILLAVFVLAHLIELIGAVIFTMPMVLVVAPVVAIENLGVTAAIKRSWSLGIRRYGVILLILMSAWAVTQVLSGAFTTVPTIVGAALGPDYGWIVYAIGAGIGQIVIAPVVVGISVMTYMDLRVRTEGLDLELRAEKAFAR